MSLSNSKELTHEEWDKENSLTAPMDRDPKRTYKPNQVHPELNNDEFESAFKSQNNDTYTKKFPRVERRYADPPINLQNIGLISFVPAKGAKPNDNGVYGFAKIRGNYATETEANERAEYLIRYVDSYHQIYHCYVGRPFPLTTTSKYSAETTEIDLKKEMTETISNNIKNKKLEEKKIVEDIKEREEKLLAESKREEEDPYEHYITQKVKLAQVGFTYMESLKKMDKMKETIIKTRKLIEDLDVEYPDYKDQYLGKYMEARKDAGLVEDDPNNFIKFMGSDLKEELGF